MPIINRIAEFVPEMTAWRHDLHAHPELAYEEHRTAGLVADRLHRFGVEVHRGLAGTGVVGVLRGRGDSQRAVGLRADMDALEMPELNDFAHASRHEGKMHACGHDGHTTMLLGAARYLAETRNFDGTVLFIFQPAEEGRAGARAMIDDGLFDRFPCDRVFAVHNWPEMPAGTAGVHAGPVMASADRFELTVHGKGGHAAIHHNTVDPLPIAAQIIQAAQTLVSRQTSPLDSAVISFTRMHAGTTFNVIPDTARLGGTVRALRAETRDRLERSLIQLANGVAASCGASLTMDYQRSYPATVNHAAEAELAARAIGAVVGAERVARDPPPSMGAEDFAFMLQARPGAYIWLGQGHGPDTPMVHSSRYDFDDALLPVGASYWATLTEMALPRSAV